MLFRTIYDDGLAQAAYLVGCQKTGEALVIDPERDVDRYIEAARREGLRITAIAETHIHADFLSGARELAEKTGAKLYLSAMGGDEWSYRWLDRRSDGGSYDHQLLRDGDSFMVGNIRIEALHTPGHTPEHMSYVVTDIGGGANEPMGIATGDFVFVGDVGRPDLLESAAGMSGAAAPAAEALHESLRRFNALPDYLQVWPGHGAGSACGKALGAIPQSTVGYEKRFNAPLASAAGPVDEFVEGIIEGQPEPPPYFARMKMENRGGPAILGSLPQPEHVAAESLAAANEGEVVIDTRPWSEFRAGFIEGSLNAPFNRDFPTIAGSYVEPDQKITLVIDEEDLHDAVVALIRIGLDHVVGYVTPAELRAWIAKGNEVATIAEVTPEEFQQIRREGAPTVLDVRKRSEFVNGHLPEASNLAHTRLHAELDRVPQGSPLYVHCQSGIRSAAASAYLRRQGREVVNVSGGFARIRELADDTVTEQGAVAAQA